jgi:hypothetical protein
MASGWCRTRDAPLQGYTVEGDWSASEQQQPPEGPGFGFPIANALLPEKKHLRNLKKKSWKQENVLFFIRMFFRRLNTYIKTFGKVY